MKFTVHCTNDQIWNYTELVKFLADHQQQSIELVLNPEAISAHTIALYDLLDCFEFESVTIATHNPLEHHSRYHIKYINYNRFAREDGSAAESHWQWNRSKKFLTLYGRPTANRLGLAAHLYAHHRDHTHLHFSAATDPDSLQLFELDKLLSYDTAVIESVGQLLPNLPCLVNSKQGYMKTNYNYEDNLTAMYQDALIDVVSEAHVAGSTFFPTEKTFRPMWARRPFVVFGSENYLAYLRQMGFRTFGDFWDESYDGYTGRDRFRRMIELIDQLAQKSYNELESMWWDMAYSLEHNYNLLKTQSYSTKIERIDP